MNEFNIKYEKNKLNEIYNDNEDLLNIELDIDNVELSCKSLLKQLEEIRNYVISRRKPDIRKYKEWDIDTAMIWIKSLDNGAYQQYCDVLRNGFESDGIPSAELPNVGQADLRINPFNIQSFMDRKKLAQHFKSLEIQNDAIVPLCNKEGTKLTEYH